MKRAPRFLAPLASFILAFGAVTALPSPALAQVNVTDTTPRLTPPVPKSPEDLGAAYGVFMIILGVVLLGLVVGATLIPPKRGHQD